MTTPHPTDSAFEQALADTYQPEKRNPSSGSCIEALTMWRAAVKGEM